MEELGLGRTGLGSESLGSLGGALLALELQCALLPASKHTDIPLYRIINIWETIERLKNFQR